MASITRTHSLVFACLVLGLFPLGCRQGGQPKPSAPAAEHASKDAKIRLFFISDPEGYLEPCGCQSTSLGGMDRLATQISKAKQDGVPYKIIALGNLLFESGGAHMRDDASAQTQELWKAETLMHIFNGLPLDLAVGGPGDQLYGHERQRELYASAKFPIHGPGAAQAGDTPLPTHGKVLLPTRAGPLGVTFATGDGDGDGARPALTATLTRHAQALREAGALTVVALLVLPARQARQLAATIEGTDFVVLGGQEQDGARPPETVNHTLLLTGDRHGRGLLVVDATIVQPGQPFVDQSPWTQDAALAERQEEAAALAERIAVWERDPEVDQALVTRQKERLAELKRPIARPQPTAEQNRLQAQLEPITTDLPQAPSVRAKIAAYDARVNAHNREALAGRLPPTAAPGQAVYVGSAQCKSCHEAAYRWWQGHAHGRAYSTLQERNKEYNLGCVGCHVTGYEQPGGSTVTHNDGLTDVGCESCHGPGSLHQGDIEQIVTAPQASTCITCHNVEHSDQFDFKRYRERLLAPGHGLPEEG